MENQSRVCEDRWVNSSRDYKVHPVDTDGR